MNSTLTSEESMSNLHHHNVPPSIGFNHTQSANVRQSPTAAYYNGTIHQQINQNVKPSPRMVNQAPTSAVGAHHNF